MNKTFIQDSMKRDLGQKLKFYSLQRVEIFKTKCQDSHDARLIFL